MFRFLTALRNLPRAPRINLIPGKSKSYLKKPEYLSASVKWATRQKSACEIHRRRKVRFLEERRSFQSSADRKAPPLLLFLAKPIAKYSAIIFGKTLRKWWLNLPPEQRELVVSNLKARRTSVYGGGLVAIFGFLIYYRTHMELDPLTGRRKFIILSDDQILQMGRAELDIQVQKHGANFLVPSHPSFKKVANVSNKLIKSNEDIQQMEARKWVVTVVDDPKIRNAFVLPTGHIFIFTGLLTLCSSDDQLGVIIGHEISHVILKHSAEQISNLGLINLLLILPLILMWVILPDSAAAATQILSDYFTKVMFHLPFARHLESEADEIGLMLAAKACFDVREASVLWAKMALMDDGQPEWLSTHPRSEHRRAALDLLMPRAIKLREESKCPPLPATDPRNSIPKKPYHHS